MIDKELMSVLVCPICKGKLDYKKEANELICRNDYLAYPIKEGIAVMLEDAARVLDLDERLKHSR